MNSMDFLSEQDVHRIHQAGFNVIRNPLHARFFQMEDAEGFIARFACSLRGRSYSGTRFDWSGIISSIQFAGHEYVGPVA